MALIAQNFLDVFPNAVENRKNQISCTTIFVVLINLDAALFKMLGIACRSPGHYLVISPFKIRLFDEEVQFVDIQRRFLAWLQRDAHGVLFEKEEC